MHHVNRVPNPPPADIFTINLTPLKAFLVDLPAGALKGMLHERDGWQAVVNEITTNQPTFGDRAGITATDYGKFTSLNTQYTQIEAQVPVVAKAAEVLVESLANTDSLRHRFMTLFADAAEAHANAEGGDVTLLTAYEKTIAYRAIADKALKTRKKNEEGKAKGATGATGATGGTGAGKTT